VFYLAIEKYRVHEVAKDFGLPTKTITEILTKYGTAPKNHMQVLTDRELSIIFDHLTQDHPVSDIQVIFQDTYQEAKPAPAEEKKPAPQPAQGKPAAPQGQRPQAPQSGGSQPHKQPGGRPAQGQPPAQPGAAGQQSQQPPLQKPASRETQKKIVDTRKGGDVNLAKYDERLETLGGQQGERMQRQQRSGREKVRGNQQRREEQHQQQQEEEHSSGDFLQKLRLGLVSLETI